MSTWGHCIAAGTSGTLQKQGKDTLVGKHIFQFFTCRRFTLKIKYSERWMLSICSFIKK